MLVFVTVNLQPDLLTYLALTPAEVWSQPWQIVTSMFTHAEIFHIFANMYTLYFFGSAVLQLIGAARFWLVYLAGGILECGHTYYVRVRCTSAVTGQRVRSPWSILGCLTVNSGLPVGGANK